MVDIRDDMMIGIYGKRNICIYDIKEIEEQGLVYQCWRDRRRRMYLYDEGSLTLGYPCLHLQITMLTTLVLIVVD